MKNAKTKIQTKLFQFSLILITGIILYLGVTELLNKAQDLTLTTKAKAVDYIAGEFIRYGNGKIEH